MKQGKETGSLFFPRHNELSLFLIGASILTLLAIDADFRIEWMNLKAADAIFWPIPICLVFFGQGLVFSFIHILTKGPKSSYEKFCMFCFAVFANLSAGIAASVHDYQHGGFGWLFIFPLWNLISGLLLMGVVFMTLASGADIQSMEESIDDEDATPSQVVVGLLVILLIIGLCHHAFDLHWAMTFSMCVAYISHLDHWMRKWTAKSLASS